MLHRRTDIEQSLMETPLRKDDVEAMGTHTRIYTLRERERDSL